MPYMYLAVIQYVHKYYTASTTRTKHFCVPSAEKVQPAQRQSTRHIKFWSEILPKCTCTTFIASFPGLQYANTEGEGLGDLITCGYVR